MNSHRIELIQSLHVRDSDGATFVRYTPIFSPSVIARGTLTFAVFEETIGAGFHAHEAAKRAARDNAVKLLHLLAAELNSRSEIKSRFPPVETK